MMYKKNLIVAAILSFILIGCSSSREKKFILPMNEIYTIAKEELKNGNWKQAITKLESLNDRYPFSPLMQKVQLDLIYAYYKNDNLFLAQESIERFIRLNSTYQNIDFIIYMRGLINMALDNSIFHGLFSVNHFNRDPQYAYNAIKDFSNLVQNYPNSQYIDAVKKHLFILRERVAKYEYSVADYYTRRKAWIAVINRVEGILCNYPDTKVARESLKLMENAYHQIQMTEQANKITKIFFKKRGKILLKNVCKKFIE